MDVEDIQFHPNHTNHYLVTVTVKVNEVSISYEAYAIRGMSLKEYLNNPEQVKEVSLSTNGRFALLDRGEDENILAYLISGYAHDVSQNITTQLEKEHKEKYRSFSQNGGEARKQEIRKHYEKLRDTFNQLFAENPDITDYQLAKQLNTLGHTTVGGKSWHNTNAQGMREYLQGDPHYTSRGKIR